jgi:hypothetical protein
MTTEPQNLQAVLVEITRVAAKPGELILFKLPPAKFDEDWRMARGLGDAVRAAAPGLPFLVVCGDVQVQAISAQEPIEVPA